MLIALECFLAVLDNTFFGTVFAGLLLTFVGFRFYARQKVVDMEFEDLRKLRDAAASLYAAIDSASNKIGGLFNMYDNQNGTLSRILRGVGPVVEAGLNDKVGKELETLSTEITTLSENLTTRLKIKNTSAVQLDVVANNIMILNLFMQSASITIRKSNPEEVKGLRTGWNNAKDAVYTELNKILK